MGGIGSGKAANPALVKALPGLLQSNLTLREIGARFGISPQRVQQLARKMPGWDSLSRRRRRSRAVASRTKKAEGAWKNAEIKKRCPFPVDLVPRKAFPKNGFSADKVLILGNLCKIITVGRYPDGRGMYRTRWRGDPKTFDFVIGLLADGRVMLFPAALYKNSTFVLGQKKASGAHEHFHGWNDLVNAWHLMKKKL